MSEKITKPRVVRGQDVPMFGPGHDESHYISVPIKQYYSLDGVGNVGVCHIQPGDETVVFAIEAKDDGTVPHYYGPCDEFYYVLDGEFTVWWGTDANDLDNHFVLHPGDCTHYTTGWKYKVKNTGNTPARFFYFLTNPPGIKRRMD